MRVERYQFPIGQGCFHAGTICLPDEVAKEFHYVYDCGSRKKGVLQYAIDVYTAQTSSIEALFVSHLDDDHVSGLDRLLTKIEVNTVYIPYVDPWVFILDLIEAEMNGDISASLVEASMEPASWFGRRGVGRVVRIRGSDNSPPDVANEPNQDDSPRAPDVRGHHSNVQKPFDNLGVETPSPMQKLQKKEGERSELLEAAPGFRITFSATSASNLESDWLLLPHVDPASEERGFVFKKRMRNVLGLQSKQRLTSVVLKEAFRDKEKRKAMRGCYEAISPNHNRISMSLYSGPDQFKGGKKWKYCLQDSLWCDEELHWPIGIHPFFSLRSAVGWIGTGDADLRMNKVREKWQDTFEPFKNNVSTLLLPHHGSKCNFHQDLLQFPNLNLCVASSSDPSPYGHPSGEVVGEIWSSGKVFCHVTQNTYSALIEKMRLV